MLINSILLQPNFEDVNKIFECVRKFLLFTSKVENKRLQGDHRASFILILKGRYLYIIEGVSI